MGKKYELRVGGAISRFLGEVADGDAASIPEGALRRGQNARLGALGRYVGDRPGFTRLNAAALTGKVMGMYQTGGDEYVGIGNRMYLLTRGSLLAFDYLASTKLRELSFPSETRYFVIWDPVEQLVYTSAGATNVGATDLSLIAAGYTAGLPGPGFLARFAPAALQRPSDDIAAYQGPPVRFVGVPPMLTGTASYGLAAISYARVGGLQFLTKEGFSAVDQVGVTGELGGVVRINPQTGEVAMDDEGPVDGAFHGNLHTLGELLLSERLGVANWRMRNSAGVWSAIAYPNPPGANFRSRASCEFRGARYIGGGTAGFADTQGPGYILKWDGSTLTSHRGPIGTGEYGPVAGMVNCDNKLYYLHAYKSGGLGSVRMGSLDMDGSTYNDNVATVDTDPSAYITADGYRPIALGRQHGRLFAFICSAAAGGAASTRPTVVLSVDETTPTAPWTLEATLTANGHASPAGGGYTEDMLYRLAVT